MLVATICLNLLAAPAEPGIPWRTDLGPARKEAAEKGLPLLIVFR